MNGTFYAVRIRAVTANNTKSPSSTAVNQKPYTVPGKSERISLSAPNSDPNQGLTLLPPTALPVDNGDSIVEYQILINGQVSDFKPCLVQALADKKIPESCFLGKAGPNGDGIYVFTARYRNAAGWGPESDPTQLSWFLPLSPPRNVRAFNITPFEATIAWDPPENNGGSTIEGYRVWALIGSSTIRDTCSTERVNNTPPATACTLTNLSSNSTYTINVEVLTATRFASNNGALTFTTLVAPPTGVANRLRGVVLSGGKAEFRWSASASTEEALWRNGWYVEWTSGLSPEGGQCTLQSPNKAPQKITLNNVTSSRARIDVGGDPESEFTCTLTGLNSGQQYEFRVQTFGRAGSGDFRSVILKYRPPSSPVTASAEIISSDAIRVSTRPGNELGGSVSSYQITARTGGQTVSTCSIVVGALDDRSSCDLSISSSFSGSPVQIFLTASNALGTSLTGRAQGVFLLKPSLVTSCGYSDVPGNSSYAISACLLRQAQVILSSTLSPSTELNRSTMAVWLWNTAGRPSALNHIFQDESSIPSGDTRLAADWLYQQGITVSDPFDPSGLVNRGHMALFLWRMAGRPSALNHIFQDESSIPSGDTRLAADWLYQQGITVSDPYKPADIVSRSQIVVFLDRFGQTLGYWPKR